MEEALDAEVLNNRLDKWLQRAAVAAMVGVAVTLMVLGFVMYSQTPVSPSEVEGLSAGLSEVDGPRKFGKEAGPATDKVTLTKTASK